MDMQLNPKIIRQLREDRAWSQNQLAEVADLSLRTIQRIEKSGMASYESAQALAAAFETPLTTLSQKKPSTIVTQELQPKILPRIQGLLAGLTLSLSALFFLTTAQADQVALDIGFAQGEDISAALRTFKISTENGAPGKFGIDKEYQVEITPTADMDGLVLMTVNFYRQEAGEYKLLAQPKVLVKENEMAQFIFENDAVENKISLWITPSLEG